jgi:AmiR/NasT family two-component response regulator
MKPLKEINVLIADDDFMVSQMIRGQLEDLGHTVVAEASDGREAVEMAQKFRPDIILMDIEMPEMDGIEAAQQILACCPTPIVVLTAYESPELVEQVAEVGAGAYLVKPCSAQALERAIMIATFRFNDLLKLRQLNAQLVARNQELQAALAEIKTLSGLIPICANCKKIRDDQGYWQQVELYISQHSSAEFTSTLCPTCIKKLYPELYNTEQE